jgi:hypothetical protein
VQSADVGKWNQHAIDNKITFNKKHNGELYQVDADSIRKHIIDNNQNLANVLNDFKVVFNPEVESRLVNINMRYIKFLGMHNETASTYVASTRRALTNMGKWVADMSLADLTWESAYETTKKTKVDKQLGTKQKQMFAGFGK